MNLSNKFFGGYIELYGILLDTMSIQRYIFATNRLKENLGASYLVEDIYGSTLKETLKEMFNFLDDAFFKKWEDDPDNMQVIVENGQVEIGYIGGGNALLLFKNEEGAITFVKKWTSKLLVKSPGIIPAVAIDMLNITSANDNNFGKEKDKLFRKLAESKGKYIPQTIIPRHGITAECSHTGYSMETWCEELPKDEQKYLSSVSTAKITAAKLAKDKLENLLKELKLSKYTFTDQLDKLGQQRGEDSHIAIVHIDGNEMGERFKKQKTLSELRKLSSTVKKATLNSFKELINSIDSNFEYIKKEFNISKENNKDILPIRPIIIGGDDITFVCDGRLGIYFAKVFLEKFEKQNDAGNNNLSLTACAGVSIIKTKYPFYRGYQIAEDLLQSAKNKRKKENDNGSWIDFHLAYGGFSGELEQIREKHYKTHICNLLMRPYKLSDLDELLKGVAEFKNKKNGKDNFPRSKIMELRKVLYSSEDSQKIFLEEIITKKLKLPKYKYFTGDKIVENKETPYFDMIELLELYPDFALPGRSL